jgi:hypothetical protein
MIHFNLNAIFKVHSFALENKDNMIEIGKYNHAYHTFVILKLVYFGYPENWSREFTISFYLTICQWIWNRRRTYCFVYLDHERAPVATTLNHILLNEFALLRVNYVNQLVLYGLGYGKDILVPFRSKHDQWKRQTLLSLPLYGRKNKPFGSFVEQDESVF